MDQFSNILPSDLFRVMYQQDLYPHQFLIETILTASGLKNLSYHCSDAPSCWLFPTAQKQRCKSEIICDNR